MKIFKNDMHKKIYNKFSTFRFHRTLPHTLKRNSTKNTTQPGIASSDETLDPM